MADMKKCAYCKDPFMPKRADQECCCRDCSKSFSRRKMNTERKSLANSDKEQLAKPQRKRPGKPKLSLAEIEALAREEGMHYGPYVGKYGL